MPLTLHKLARISLPLLSLIVTGCGHHGTVVPPSVYDVGGNWQMQSSTGGTNAGILLLGSLTQSGTNVAATMRFADLSLPNSCGTPLQTITLNGATSASGETQSLQLVSPPLAGTGSVVKVNLTLPGTQHNIAFGSIEVDGTTCSYPPSGGGIGAQIGSITGSFTGTLTAPASLQTDPTGNGKAQLTLTQASTPQADGQYPITGSLAFQAGTCSDTESLTGLVSGASATLASAPVNGVSNVQVTSGVNPSGLQLPGFTVFFAAGPCGTGLVPYSTFAGTISQAAANAK